MYCNKKPGGDYGFLLVLTGYRSTWAPALLHPTEEEDYGLPAAMALADQSIAELTETVRSTLTEQGALQVSDPTR